MKLSSRTEIDRLLSEREGAARVLEFVTVSKSVRMETHSVWFSAPGATTLLLTTESEVGMMRAFLCNRIEQLDKRIAGLGVTIDVPPLPDIERESIMTCAARVGKAMEIEKAAGRVDFVDIDIEEEEEGEEDDSEGLPA